MLRGSISKQEHMDGQRLERKILNRQDLLILKRNLCNGCGICSEVCPKGSITLKPAVIEDGRLLHSPSVNIDEKTCIMCGMCAAFCQLGALQTWVNDEKIAMFVDRKAIPPLTKSIDVMQELCKSNCEFKCEKSCPRNAIKVSIKNDGQIQEIINVQVDKDLCTYCKVCEYTCPYKAIIVQKPFEGSVRIEKEKCLKNCQVCIDICPSEAITLKDGMIEVFREFCVYCKACQRVCPKGAIHVEIDRVSNVDIKSATWIKLLEKLASYRVVTKELVAKSREKQYLIAKNRIY